MKNDSDPGLISPSVVNGIAGSERTSIVRARRKNTASVHRRRFEMLAERHRGDDLGHLETAHATDRDAVEQAVADVGFGRHRDAAADGPAVGDRHAPDLELDRIAVVEPKLDVVRADLVEQRLERLGAGAQIGERPPALLHLVGEPVMDLIDRAAHRHVDEPPLGAIALERHHVDALGASLLDRLPRLVRR